MDTTIIKVIFVVFEFAWVVCDKQTLQLHRVAPLCMLVHPLASKLFSATMVFDGIDMVFKFVVNLNEFGSIDPTSPPN